MILLAVPSPLLFVFPVTLMFVLVLVGVVVFVGTVVGIDDGGVISPKICLICKIFMQLVIYQYKSTSYVYNYVIDFIK